jgi:hypothetical protein
MESSRTQLTKTTSNHNVYGHQRSFNYIDDNALINQLLALLEVGLEFSLRQTPSVFFVNLSVLTTVGRTSWFVHRKNLAAKEKKHGPLESNILLFLMSFGLLNSVFIKNAISQKGLIFFSQRPNFRILWPLDCIILKKSW